MQLAHSIVFYYLLFSIIHTVLSENEQFKINKLNLVWAKAQHSLGSSKLKGLKNDLTKHEVDELILKRLKAHNEDKEGLFEASVRKRLLTILSKYSLERYFDDIHPPVNNEHKSKKENLHRAKIESDGTRYQTKEAFRDKKLDKLWKKAELSGFTQEELMVLHEEFQHQQDKISEHYEMMNSMEEELDAEGKKNGPEENSIEDKTENEQAGSKKEDSSFEKKQRLNMNTNQALREKYVDIKRNIDKLQRKIASGKIDDTAGPFEESPVNVLWSAAMKANFTNAELESLKEELEHYEHRIQKLKHFQVQLERDEIAGVKKSSSEVEDGDVTKHLRRRVKELSHTVDKIHSGIENKILKHRDEL